jgi:hypothetical protein
MKALPMILAVLAGGIAGAGAAVFVLSRCTRPRTLLVHHLNRDHRMNFMDAEASAAKSWELATMKVKTYTGPGPLDKPAEEIPGEELPAGTVESIPLVSVGGMDMEIG